MSDIITDNIFTPEDFNEMNKPSSCDFYIHNNISSISYHIDDLNSFLGDLSIKPKLIGISESRLISGKDALSNICIEGYVYESTTTESCKGGTMIYVNKDTQYKTRDDLNIYKSKKIESTFIGIIESKMKNKVIGCTYKHPKVSISEFTNDFISPLLEKLQLEKKEIILMGDFNINLLNNDTDYQVSDFLNTIYANTFYPTINSPSSFKKTSIMNKHAF